MKPISPEQEELIHRLVYFQNEYEHPSDDDVKRIIVSIQNIKTLVISLNVTDMIFAECTYGRRRSM